MNTFTRDFNDDWDDGWSRVPHGLWTLKLPAGALVLLGWLHSHTPGFLAGVTMSQCRRAVGSSSIYTWFDALEEAGFVKVERGDNGKAAKVELLFAPWKALLGRDQSEIGSVTSPKSDDTGDQREDHASSLRSEDAQPTQERTQNQVAGDIARTYWDWYKFENEDRTPTIRFVALAGVAKRLLTSGYAEDDIVDAMKTARAWTAKQLAAEIDRKRADAESRTVTVSVPHGLVRAFAKAEVWLGQHGIPPKGRPFVMNTCARLMSNHGFGVGETMIRLAIALRNTEGTNVDETGFYTAMLTLDRAVDRFADDLPDYPAAMDAAWTNRYWRAS